MASDRSSRALRKFQRLARSKGYDCFFWFFKVSECRRDDCPHLRFDDMPAAVEAVLDDPLGGRDDLDGFAVQNASGLLKRHGCYTQWARMLRVRCC